MTQRTGKPQRPRHIPILDEDWEWLEAAYGPASPSKLGVGPAIRASVNNFVKAQRAKAQKILDGRAQPAAQATEPVASGELEMEN